MLLHGFIIQKPWGTMDLLSFQVRAGVIALPQLWYFKMAIFQSL